MPIYNTDKNYVRVAIMSILSQSIKDFELIVIDDGSDVPINLDEYNDNRLKLIKLEKNMGISHALNRGIETSNGKYIARMDSDDISSPDRFEQQLKLMNKYSIVSSNVFIINDKGEQIGTSKVLLFHNTLRRFQLYRMKKNPVNHPTIFAKREVFEKFKYDEYYSSAQDFELWLRMAKTYKVYFDKSHLLFYRISNRSNQSNYKAIIDSIKARY